MTSTRSVVTAAILGASALAFAATAPGLRAEEETGRYTMSPTEDGFLRLDRTTGSVSHCRKAGSDWACELVADDRRALQAEIDALHTENERLKHQLADANAELPTEEEMERTFSFFENFIQRFAKAARVFRDEMAAPEDEAAPESAP